MSRTAGAIPRLRACWRSGVAARIGHAGAGFSAKKLTRLLQRAQALQRPIQRACKRFAKLYGNHEI